MFGLIGRIWGVAATVAAPGLRVMLRRRAARGKEVGGRLAERFGFAGGVRPAGRVLWLHAASVGETVSALPLVAALPADVTVLFTTGTVTSADLLVGRAAAAGLAGRVVHRFVPLDVPGWAARFLDAWRPDAACFLESELWPNLLAGCAARGIAVALVNARLSARSAARWGRVPGFARAVLGGFAWVAAQSEADAGRLRALGARRVEVLGDLKFAAAALPADAAEVARLMGVLGGRTRWLAASTHPADDAMVAACHAALSARHPGLLTAIVPRHPSRGGAVAAAFGAGRRSLGEGPAGGGVWVADTLGELGLLYRCFPVVFMGKSFAGGGGQNPWEAARLGCAVVCGPDMQNFGDAVARLGAAGGLVCVADAGGLVEQVDAWLRDPAGLAAAGEAGRRAAVAGGDLPRVLAGRLVALMSGAAG